MPRRSELPESLTPSAFQILLALADEARHGLGIVDEIRERTAGAVGLGPGTLYGTIKKLREVGFIQEAGDGQKPRSHDPRRRYYALTPRGKEAVRREALHLEQMVQVARSKAILDRAD
jgi:DNA-binding PadR family transcriptional regulator